MVSRAAVQRWIEDQLAVAVTFSLVVTGRWLWLRGLDGWLAAERFERAKRLWLAGGWLAAWLIQKSTECAADRA